MTTHVRLALGCASLFVWTAAADPIGLADLLAEMNDLQRLAERPAPAYECLQFSSYDRTSTDPNDPNTWFANYDRGQYLRIEQRDGRKEHVMVDAEGPGATVRIWSANPGGTLRFYFDGADEPGWVVPMKELLGGEVAHVPVPIAGMRAAGWNSYLPIPYAKGCKITCDAGGFYYIVNYRKYEPTADVRTFDPAQLESLAPQIAQAAQALTQRSTQGADADAPLTSKQLSIAPGETASVRCKTPAQARGGAIAMLRAKLDADDPNRALRQTILRATFDGEQTVETPLGDFFGSAPGVNPYDSLPLGMGADGTLWSRWFMPYRQQAEFSLTNLGDQPVKAQLAWRSVPYRWTERSMHFHAGWKADYDVDTKPDFDWTYCDLRGSGVFVGAAFHVTNPVKQWWGEGDEKIYIDGAQFPQWFGTGTEDYYGYAWCSPEPFTHAYHNQTRAHGPVNYGHVSVNRWHIMDAIPFEQSLRFDMEIWHWIKTEIDAFVTTYWYARPGGQSDHKPLAANDVRWRTLGVYVPPRVAGALEGEEMRVIRHAGDVVAQSIPACSNEQHLWWHGALKPGDELELAFKTPAAGRYRVFGRFVTSGDYGICAIRIGAAEPTEGDFYSERVEVTPEIDLGVHELPAGEARLTVELLGANPKSHNGRLFGLDYVRLEPVEP